MTPTKVTFLAAAGGDLVRLCTWHERWKWASWFTLPALSGSLPGRLNIPTLLGGVAVELIGVALSVGEEIVVSSSERRERCRIRTLMEDTKGVVKADAKGTLLVLGRSAANVNSNTIAVRGIIVS
mmetsp:Transcript_33656/g.41235  ORF Transcript_33656/g.41235 Transcript_33656/m.41235 type:complete len:125 (-) Transcript_33656:73-447(-)